MEFCKTFNAKTQEFEKGMPIPVIITYYQDKSFTLEMKTPPASYLLKKAAKVDGGAKKPGYEVKGSVTQADIKIIAETKMKDLNAVDIDAAMKIIAGSARSMGLEVKG
jgi:large subunit ribosomal protein L11